MVPVIDRRGTLIGVFDVDAEAIGAFDEVDAAGIERILRESFG